MKTIKEEKELVYIKEKSKFIGIIKKVSSKEDIDNILLSLKDKYSDATHICYAYILPHAKKYYDDNEPLGTAGLPILKIIEKNNLCYVLGIVIRYFGGIKLGSNGLVRAYSHTISEIIIDNNKDIEEAYLIKIQEDYSQESFLNYLLKEDKKLKKEYTDKIIIYAIIKKKRLEEFFSIHYEIIEERII